MARLIVKDAAGEKTIELKDTPVSFGRGPENAVVMNDREYSRRHFQVERFDGGYKLVDLESRNGTRVNGRTVNQHLLKPGDAIEVGATRVVFVDPEYRETFVPSMPMPLPPPPLPPPPPPPKPEEAPPAPVPTPVTPATPAPAAPAVQESPPPPKPVWVPAPPRRPRPPGPNRRTQAVLWLAVAFGVALAAVIVLPHLLSESPEALDARDKIERARLMEADYPRDALKLYDAVPREAGEVLYRQARDGAEAIRARLGPGGEKPADARESAEFERLLDLRRKSPDEVEQIISKGEDFRRAWPSSAYTGRVEDILEEGRSRRDLVQLRLQVDALVAKGDYCGAMAAVGEAVRRYEGNVKLRQEAGRVAERAIAAARQHHAETVAAAQKKADAGERPEARRLLTELMARLSAAPVPEFADLVKIAKVRLDALEP